MHATPPPQSPPAPSRTPIQPSVEGESVPVFYRDVPWRQRVEHVVDAMREISMHTDPASMVLAYAKRMRGTLGATQTIAISRRDLASPLVRVTRNSAWTEAIDPWREKDRLPVLTGGLFSRLIWGDEPVLIPDLHEESRLEADDPALAFIGNARSLVAIPHYENKQGLNMVMHLAQTANAFDPEAFPQLILNSNLFGRGTKSMILARELREANMRLDGELRSVQEMQLNLLPESAPAVPGLALATHYQTSARAGGDYYDFFALPGGLWGIMIADVSGHGTPAAVLMAVVHALAHMMPGEPLPAGEALAFINRALCARYTKSSGAFVTMIYGIYDPAKRSFTFANAGHPHPILRSASTGLVRDVEHPDAGFPLGIVPDATYAQHTLTLARGDALVLFTDGITEAFAKQPLIHFPALYSDVAAAERRELFGEERLRRSVALAPIMQSAEGTDVAQLILNQINQDVGTFAGLDERSDDRTVVVARAM